MGSLRDFDLAKLKERFRLRVLVETGTGEGHSLIYAQQVGDWDRLDSIEIDPTLMTVMAPPPGTAVWNGRSVEMLPLVLERIAGMGPALFWLDAHFPGNLSGVPIDAEPDMSVRLPLEEELRVITANRDVSLDLFIIDDAWIYRDGIAGCGDWEEREAVTGGMRDDFIRELLDETHLLFQDPRANGYTIAAPMFRVTPIGFLAEAIGVAAADNLREF